jgi:hypothetical protein
MKFSVTHEDGDSPALRHGRGIQYVEHAESHGDRLFEAICKLDLEGDRVKETKCALSLWPLKTGSESKSESACGNMALDGAF